MDWVSWIVLLVGLAFFFMWGWGEGGRAERKRRPQTTIDKVGDVVLDFDWGWSRATIITDDAMWKVSKKTRDGRSVVVFEGDNELVLTMDEAQQMGRALQYVSWRKIDE